MIEPRDSGGPYVVVQEGYDPQDFKMRLDEFMLGGSGEWLTVGQFFKLPQEVRQREFIFGTAAEVIALLERLPADAVIIRRGDEHMPVVEQPEEDDLNTAVAEAKKAPPSV